jgi:phytoene synthase
MLSPLGEIVRRHDPDRFLTALFAPADGRETLFVLYSFNHELARAREAASSATLALIRLQWWREVVRGAPHYHPVADGLRAAVADRTLDRDLLLRLIDGREPETEPEIATRAAWRTYLFGSAGLLAEIAARTLGASAEAAAAVRALGAAYGAAGVLRSVAAHARQDRCLLPADLLAAHGLSPEAVVADAEMSALRPVRQALAAEAQGWLRESPRLQLPRRAIAAVLPAVLAARDLRRGDARGERGIDDRLAVMFAGISGRLSLRPAVPGWRSLASRS